MTMVDTVIKKVLNTSEIPNKPTQEELTEKVTKHLEGKRFKAWCQTCGVVFIDIDYTKYLELHSWDDCRPDRWFVLMFRHYVLNQEHIIMHSVPDVGWTNFTPECKMWYDRQKINLGSDKIILRDIDRYVKHCDTKL